MKTIGYIFFGAWFGAVLLLSGAFSWTVVYDMFHFQSFHMYGLLFSAILTAALGVLVIKKRKPKDFKGRDIQFQPKPLEWKKNLTGGILFGMGWGITGACSAPLYILVGKYPGLGLLLLAGAVLGVVGYAFYLQPFTFKKVSK
ncbi:MAG: YeeE/YedE family protein [Crocinitomicaceae bacterium]|jgi:uncharacterized membrane protein YedE/YeeE|nr:YeeE/YedE family protein [Crocinitomicaceae bacterium]